MIVLHQHDRLLDVLHLGEQRFGEALVDGAVVLPVAGAEARPLVHDVAERPQPLVGEAVVITSFLLVAQPHAPQRVGRIRRRQADALADLAIGVAAAMGDPHAAARLHDGAERGDEAAGRLLLAHDAAVAHVTHRLAVGDDEHRPAAEAELDELLEAFLGPDALARQPQPRLLLGGAARARQRAREARHLGGERAEQALVRIGRRRHRTARLHLLGPLGDALDRTGDGPTHERPRDAGDEEHEHAHPHGRPTPQIPLAGLEVLGVEQHGRGADGAIVLLHGHHVDPGQPAGHVVKAGDRLVAADRVGDERRQRAEERADVRSRPEHAAESVVDGEATIGGAEAGEHALVAGARPAGHQPLGRLRNGGADEGGAPLECVDLALALLADFEVREAGRDDQRRQPDAAEQAHEEAHAPKLRTSSASGRWPSRAASDDGRESCRACRSRRRAP